jgi:hypothetical protein
LGVEKAPTRSIRYSHKTNVEWPRSAASVAGTLGNIANDQGKQGKFSEALETFQKVIDIFQRALGPRHADKPRLANIQVGWRGFENENGRA